MPEFPVSPWPRCSTNWRASAGVVVVLYVDLRMRREGLDRALRAAAADTSGGQLAVPGQ
jgi:hypothetical protein